MAPSSRVSADGYPLRFGSFDTTSIFGLQESEDMKLSNKRPTWQLQLTLPLRDSHTNTGFFKEHLMFQSKKTFIESPRDRSVKCPHLSSQLQMRTDRCSVQMKFYHPGTVQPVHPSYKLSRFPARPFMLLQTRAASAGASRSWSLIFTNVRIACLCWPGNAEPTIHPDL